MRASEGSYFIRALNFSDSNENILYEYNPLNRGGINKIYTIDENKEIIGVYGNHNSSRWFRSFGFIVKVK